MCTPGEAHGRLGGPSQPLVTLDSKQESPGPALRPVRFPIFAGRAQGLLANAGPILLTGKQLTCSRMSVSYKKLKMVGRFL